MRKFVIRVGLFLSPLFVLLIAYELIMRRIENDYSYKNHCLESCCDKVEILAIGSSHCYYGIDPDCFSRLTYNAALESQSIKYDYLIFDKFCKKMTSLKYLILTISYPDPFYCVEDAPHANAIIKNYTLYFHFPSDNIVSYFETLNGINYHAIWGFFTKHNYILHSLENGFYDHNFEDPYWRERVVLETKQHSYDSYPSALRQKLLSNYDVNMNYMNKIINLCKKNNIHVILLTTPCHELYRSNISCEQLQRTIDFCNILTAKYDNVSYINLFNDESFSENDFLNAGHLNLNGAQKLSLILRDYVDSLNCISKK